MRSVFALCLMVLIPACAAGFRDTGVAMTSMAAFQPERYAGLWYEVAAYPTVFQAGCSAATADYRVTEAGLTVRNACRRSGGESVIEGSARIVGPGRLSVRLDGVPLPAEYWVLWVDEGYRTAVVGVPSGRAGWILNRTPEIPPDRLTAARRVLAFNGYDLGALRMTGEGSR